MDCVCMLVESRKSCQRKLETKKKERKIVNREKKEPGKTLAVGHVCACDQSAPSSYTIIAYTPDPPYTHRTHTHDTQYRVQRKVDLKK